MKNVLVKKYAGTDYEITHVTTLNKFVAMLVDDSLCDTSDKAYEDELIDIQNKALEGFMSEDDMISYIKDYGWNVEKL